MLLKNLTNAVLCPIKLTHAQVKYRNVLYVI